MVEILFARKQDVDNLTGAIVALSVVFDGAGLVVPTGLFVDVPIPEDYNLTAERWTLVGDLAGNMVVDVWKVPFSGFPPTIANTITGIDKPTLTAADHAQSSTLNGWTTSISGGDVLRFYVESATTIRKATLTLRLRRTT